MSALVLRPARVRDVPALERLVSDVLEETFRPIAPALTARLVAEAFPADWLTGDWPGLTVADLDGRPVGLVETHGDRLTELWVAPRVRRRGVGSALLACGERRIAVLGHRRAWLTVLAENHRARAFYRRHGWIDVAVRAHPRSGIPTIEMHRRLAPADLPGTDAGRAVR